MPKDTNTPKDNSGREYKTIDNVNPGDVVFGPTPGLQEINREIDFNLSIGGGDGSVWHPQIVLGKTDGGRRLRTVMLTSLGLDEDMTIWDLWPKKKYTKKEWGKNLRYLVPLEPRTVDPVRKEIKEINQPNVVIKYADNSDQLPKAPWALVVDIIKLRPLPKMPNAGKYPVIERVKISEASVKELEKLVAESRKELEAAKLDPARESSAGKAVAEQEPAQDSPRGGEGKASALTSYPSGETQSPSGAQEGGLSRSFAKVAAAGKKPTISDKESYAQVAAASPPSGKMVFRRPQSNTTWKPSSAGSSKK